MRRWLKVILGLVALYVVFQLIAPSYNWKQELVMTVQTPSGAVSGAAVVGVSVTSNIKFLPDAKGINTSLKGEATVVDLGGGRYVFALLSNNPTSLVRATHAQLLKDNDGKASPFYRALRSVAGQPTPVPADAYPLLVTFTDITDPKTVQRVDPDDLDGTFGLCADGSGLQDRNAPWRAAEVSWGVWELEQWHVEADRKAAAAKGFDAAITADLLEYQALDRRRQRNRADVYTDLDGQRWKQLKEQLSLENSDDRSPLAVFNGKRNDQWPPKTFQRDTSTDCHKLKSITLEITDEPVTNGVVEKVLARNPGDGSLDKIWSSLTSEQRSILSSINWIQG